MGADNNYSYHFSAPTSHQHLPQTSESSETTATASVSPATDVILPSSHPLCQLRNVCFGNDESSDPIHLNLFPQGYTSLSNVVKNIGCEVEILKLSLAHVAEKYLRRMLAEQPAANQDEQVYLYLSCDKMGAWLMLFPPRGTGHALTVPQLQHALIQRGIIFGIDQSTLRQLPEKSDRFFQLFPIACGTLPIKGEDGQIIDYFPRTAPKQAQVAELGEADYITLNLVQNIKQGDIICEQILPTPGIAGSTVTGEVLPAQNGVPVPLPQGRNTIISEDGRYLLASRSGHMEFTGLSFQVKPVLEIMENVDHTTGNINYLGDVHIHGDVCRGFTVRAMGNIQIDGVVEASTIEAGENVVVSSGVLGQDQAVIRAQKSVFAKYLEHSNVYARKSIQADCIIDCNIFSNGTVTVCTGRGAIIGGTIRSANEVSATTVGSKAEKRTVIVLGGLPCENFEHAQILVETEALIHEISKLESQPSTPQQQSKLSKVRLDCSVAKMKLQKLNKELSSNLPPDPHNDHRRLICHAAYPGTVITIDHVSFRINQLETNCTIGLENGLVGRI